MAACACRSAPLAPALADLSWTAFRAIYKEMADNNTALFRWLLSGPT